MSDLASQPTSIQSIYTWHADNRLYVNRRYQRKLVWTLEEKQRLVESILKKYPIPAILIAEREGHAGSYEIIDGLQRLHAIISFIETSFGTLDGKIFDLQHFPSAKHRADEGRFVRKAGKAGLSQKDVSTLLDYTLALSVMRNASEAEINDVFDRINTYGHRLSDQERRQAGVQNEFSHMVRNIACIIRGDASADVLPLELMPSISVDLPKTKHGYEVQADEVVWVSQGILRSTDLRDSMDEQCIADIAACIVGNELIERSKDALDDIYKVDSAESQRISAALEVYGADRFAEEFKFCLDQILGVCAVAPVAKLRDIVFKKQTTNAFPSVFATLLIAFHELIVKEGKVVTDYVGIRGAITNLDERIQTGRKGTAPDERRKNVDQVKGLIGQHFIKAATPPPIYGSHATTDIEALIRRSEIELSEYELKQGLLTLANPRTEDAGVLEKVINTICAIANNGPKRVGKIVIGVTDKIADAERVKELDQVEPKKVGKRFIVGVDREANALGITVDQYFAKWKNAIKKSDLSESLRDSVLSSMDYNSFHGMGIIVITVPEQTELSWVGGDRAYWRNADATELAADPKRIAGLAKRF